MALLPQRMVFRLDGKPCKVCTTFRHWKPPKDKARQSTFLTTNANTNGVSSTQHKTATMMAAFASASNFSQLQSQSQSQSLHRPQKLEGPSALQTGPPDAEELGCGTWQDVPAHDCGVLLSREVNA
ncbi:hypothetical protein V8D89_012111 [Ganoderma adspersum]